MRKGMVDENSMSSLEVRSVEDLLVTHGIEGVREAVQKIVALPSRAFRQDLARTLVASEQAEWCSMWHVHAMAALQSCDIDTVEAPSASTVESRLTLETAALIQKLGAQFVPVPPLSRHVLVDKILANLRRHSGTEQIRFADIYNNVLWGEEDTLRWRALIVNGQQEVASVTTSSADLSNRDQVNRLMNAFKREGLTPLSGARAQLAFLIQRLSHGSNLPNGGVSTVLNADAVVRDANAPLACANWHQDGPDFSVAQQAASLYSGPGLRWMFELAL